MRKARCSFTTLARRLFVGGLTAKRRFSILSKNRSLDGSGLSKRLAVRVRFALNVRRFGNDANVIFVLQILKLARTGLALHIGVWPNGRLANLFQICVCNPVLRGESVLLVVYRPYVCRIRIET